MIQPRDNPNLKKVLIADDHELIRAGLDSALRSSNPKVFIQQTNSVETTLDALKKTNFDLMVLDIIMPDGSGLNVLKSMAGMIPHPRTLVLSALDEDEFALTALRLGAHGCISKASGIKKILDAIEAVASGSQFFSEETKMHAIEFMSDPQKRHPHETLSKREFEIMTLLATGQSVKEIAFNLSLRPKTVFTYRTRIYEKMAMDSVPALTRYAMRQGLIQ